MVPIKEAIISGSWLHCEKRKNLFETNQFRLKINSFEKINLKNIDEPEEIENFDNSGIIWLMKIEIINLNKDSTSTWDNTRNLKLVDNDGFKFPIFPDGHLNSYSDFSKSSGLNRFYSAYLLPKIKAIGSIAFLLPNDDDAEYFIAFENDGIVQEV